MKKYKPTNLSMLEIKKITRLMEKHFPLLLKFFHKLPNFEKLADYYRKDAYSNLIKASEDTALETEPAFQEWKKKNKIN